MFPAIVAAWFASVLNKWLRAVLPDVVAFALVPFLTVAVAAPVSLLVIGPVIQQASSLLAAAVLAVYQFSPVLCGVILGPIFGLVMIPLGLHWALIVLYYDRRLRSYPWTSLLQHGCCRRLFGVCPPLEGPE